jgi:hypothetical protein
MRLAQVASVMVGIAACSSGSTPAPTNADASSPIVADGGDGGEADASADWMACSPSTAAGCPSSAGCAGGVCVESFDGPVDSGDLEQCKAIPDECATNPTCECIAQGLGCTGGGAGFSCCRAGAELIMTCTN